MRARIPLEEIKKRFPKFVTLDESTYKGTHEKARFIDSEFGEFWAVPGDVWRGHGHRQRGNKKIVECRTTPLEDVIRKLPEHTSIIPETYVSLQKPAIFVDKEFGEFTNTPKRILRGEVHRNRMLLEKRGGSLRTIEEIKKLLPPELSIVESSYKDTRCKAKFIDKDFGEFETTVNSILMGGSCRERGKLKRKETCLKKYGVEYVSQDREILSRMKRSARKTYVLLHWKTKEELICCGGYEKFVVEYLNKNRIDFDWQIKFQLSCGVYFCDLYLKDEDLYVEIKGWWRQKISKDKWLEFHNSYTNSELWDKPKLLSMGFKR